MSISIIHESVWGGGVSAEDSFVLKGKETGSGSTAIGKNSEADGYLNTAVSGGKAIGGSFNYAADRDAKTENTDYSIALGDQSVATENNELSIGNDRFQRKITHVANGKVEANSKEAINGGQLYSVKQAAENAVQKGKQTGAGSLAVGNNSEANGYIATAVGYGKALDTYTIAMGVNAKAVQDNAIAIGTLAEAGLTDESYETDPIWDNGHYTSGEGKSTRNARSGAIAVGNLARALGYRNIAIGEDAVTAIINKTTEENGTVKETYGADVIGSVAIGGYARTEGSHSTVVGNGAYAKENFSSSYGVRSYTTGTSSAAYGDYSTVTGERGTALGSHARVDYDDSVALGSYSIADKAVSTSSMVLNGREYAFAGGEANATVSVGGQGIKSYQTLDAQGQLQWSDTDHYTRIEKPLYRTITNVAAGRISETSTDAINGSQLYSVAMETARNAETIGTVKNIVEQNSHDIHEVRQESRKGDAMNAALAALKPLQFDPDERTQIMAGFGSYKGAQGYALGLAHYFNDSVMANVGAAYTKDDSVMWNAGITIKWGSSSKKRDYMMYTPDKEVKHHVEQLEQQVASSQEEVKQLRTALLNSQKEMDSVKQELAQIRTMIQK